MADIIHGERVKKILRKMLKFGYRFLKTDMAMVSEDLKYSQNKAVRQLNALILATAQPFNRPGLKWQYNMTCGYGQSILWCVIKDTAYRDPFFWALDKLLQHPEELREMIKPYVKPPEQWIAVLWQDSRDKTKQLKMDGKIPDFIKSFEETIFTPDIQDKRHREILGLNKKKRK